MGEKRLFLYHTNDLHSALEQWPKIVHYLEQQKKMHRSRGEGALFFDLGDHADRVHAVTDATLGRGNIDLLNASPVQFATIGNNEGITFAKEVLNDLYTRANFEVVLSNLFDMDGKRPSWAKATTTYSISENGPTIGFIGVTAPFYPFYHELGWKMRDPFEVLEEELPALKQSCDIVIVLSHTGVFMDEQIAKHFDVDVIIGAHTHHRLDPALNVEGTIIAQTGKLGSHVGRIELIYEEAEKRMVRGTGRLIPITGNSPASRGTIENLNRLKEETAVRMETHVAMIEEPLPISWTEPSPFADFLVKYFKEWCGVDMAMLNAGLLLASLRAGSVTQGDLHRICPHPINPCVVTMRGGQIIETIHRAFQRNMIDLALKGYGFRGYRLGRMVFAGLDVQVERHKAGDYEVKSIEFQGEPLVRTKEYKIATADMLTFGKLYPEISRSRKKEYRMPELLRDVLAWALKNHEQQNSRLFGK